MSSKGKSQGPQPDQLALSFTDAVPAPAAKPEPKRDFDAEAHALVDSHFVDYASNDTFMNGAKRDVSELLTRLRYGKPEAAQSAWDGFTQALNSRAVPETKVRALTQSLKPLTQEMLVAAPSQGRTV